jgi:hypothetical protein
MMGSRNWVMTTGRPKFPAEATLPMLSYRGFTGSRLFFPADDCDYPGQGALRVLRGTVQDTASTLVRVYTDL